MHRKVRSRMATMPLHYNSIPSRRAMYNFKDSYLCSGSYDKMNYVSFLVTVEPL